MDFAAGVLERQCRVVRKVQLYELGSESQVRAQLSGHRWHELSTDVLVLHNGPLTRIQQLWAAVLIVSPLASLAGRTAAAEAGLTNWPGDCIEVVIDRNATISRRVFSIPGASVYVHQSRRFSADDIHPTRLPPQTTPARSLIDAAAWSRRARTACGLLAADVQQGIVTADRLAAELDKAGMVRHCRTLRRAIADIDGGAQALSEIDFARICRRHGLPEPERQAVRVDRRGRRRYLDPVLRGPDGRAVIVEVDGAVHMLPARYWDDMSRDNELLIAGERTLRFPTVALYLDERRVADQIARALGLVGVRRRYSDA